MKKVRDKFKENYSFRYFIYTILFLLLAFLCIGLMDLTDLLIFRYLLVLISILWIVLVALKQNKIVEIRSKIYKELEIEKLVNEKYIEMYIKED